MKISILLPYKENYSENYAGAVSLFINDTTKISKFKKKIRIFGSTSFKSKLSKNYTNIELNDIDVIENPVFDFNIEEICLLFNIMGLIILKSLNMKVGTEFPVPNGSNFFISS